MAAPASIYSSTKNPLGFYSFLRCSSCTIDFISYKKFLKDAQICVPKTNHNSELLNSEIDLNNFLDKISVFHKISFIKLFKKSDFIIFHCNQWTNNIFSCTFSVSVTKYSVSKIYINNCFFEHNHVIDINDLKLLKK